MPDDEKSLDEGAIAPWTTPTIKSHYEHVLRSLAVKSRDHARTPVQWDDGEHAGFTTGTPWSAVNPNHTTINADAARRDRARTSHSAATSWSTSADPVMPLAPTTSAVRPPEPAVRSVAVI